MNWETFYLICFVVGFAYTAFSFLSGTLHFHLHVPHHFHGGHGAGHSGSGSYSSSFGIFNPMTIAVFLAWFGGTGYLWSICATYGYSPVWRFPLCPDWWAP